MVSSGVPTPFDGQLDWGRRPAVLVVDMVNAYATPDSPFYSAVDSTLAPATRVLAAARRTGVPIFYTTVRYHDGGDDGGVFVRKIPALRLFAEDGPAAQVISDVAPVEADVVIEKQYASAFFGTPLATMLADRSVDSVIVMGYSTSGCVRASVVDACQNGFVPIVVRDAVADVDRAAHEANLVDIARKYGEVSDSDAVITHLLALRDASDVPEEPRD
jgi:nicotinamidase-related amidase